MESTRWATKEALNRQLPRDLREMREPREGAKKTLWLRFISFDNVLSGHPVKTRFLVTEAPGLKDSLADCEGREYRLRKLRPIDTTRRFQLYY